jgi:hypothetical protein
MTKSECRSLIKQRKTGGIADRISGVKYGNRLIEQYINSARRQLLISNIVECPITDNFLKTFFPYVQWDDMQKIAYFNLPASTVMLVDENGDNWGIQWISGTEDYVDAWIIRRNGMQYMSNLEGENHNRQICYVEGSKVLIPKIKKSDLSEGLCVKVKIVGDCNAYTDNEELPLPIKELAFIDMCAKAMDELKLTMTKTGNDGNISVS